MSEFKGVFREATNKLIKVSKRKNGKLRKALMSTGKAKEYINPTNTGA